MSVPCGFETSAEYWQQLEAVKSKKSLFSALQPTQDKLVKEIKIYKIAAILFAGIAVAGLIVAFAPILFTAKIILFATAGVAAIIAGMGLMILLNKKVKSAALAKQIAELQIVAREQSILDAEGPFNEQLKVKIEEEENLIFIPARYHEKRALFKWTNEQELQAEIALAIRHGRLYKLRSLIQSATPEILNKPYVYYDYSLVAFQGKTLLDWLAANLHETGKKVMMLKELLVAGIDSDSQSLGRERFVNAGDHSLVKILDDWKTGKRS